MLYVSLLVIVELTYVLNFVVESFKAYEIDMQLNSFETDWKKITSKYWRSTRIKAELLNLLPFGALGFIE